MTINRKKEFIGHALSADQFNDTVEVTHGHTSFGVLMGSCSQRGSRKLRVPILGSEETSAPQIATGEIEHDVQAL